MGQGTESCGGYDVEYDPYEEEMCDGFWTQRDGSSIHVSKMSHSHLTNTLRFVKGLARSASFTSEEEKWNSWAGIFEEELLRRHPPVKTVVAKQGPKQAPRGAMATMICYCGTEYQAREADLKRGWGLACCKRHAAIRREFNKPAARRK